MPERSHASIRGLHVAVLVVLISPLIVVGLAALASIGGAPAWLSSISSALTSCPSRAATGTPCPLCDTTKAALALLRGDLGKSLALNPLALALLPVGLAGIAHRLYRVVRPDLVIREETAFLLGAALWSFLVLGSAHVLR